MSRKYLEGINIDKIGKKAFALHLKMEPFSTDWHQHGKHQLVYAEGGVLYFRSEEYTLILPARFCAWIPSGSFHQLHSTSTSLYLRILYFDRTADEEPFYSKLNVFPVSNLAREMILHTYVWKPQDNDSEAQNVFFEAIRLQVPSWGDRTIPLVLPVPDHSKLRAITDFIEGHAGENLQLNAAGKQFGVSERTLMRLFRKELGMTFSSYVRLARIIKSLELLAQPGASVTETAFAVGFESLGSFSDAFYRLMRIRPSEYLKNAKTPE